MLLKVFFLLCCYSEDFAFLLDKNLQGAGGTATSNNQYLSVYEFYEEKNEQIHVTAELRHENEKLRNDMEKTFALMTSQFQNQIQILEQKIQSDGCRHNESSQIINLLEQKYLDLGQTYRDLEANNTKLRNKFTDLLTKYTKQEQELQNMRIKILENEEKTEKRLNSTDMRFESQENKTAEHGNELSKLKQLKNIQPLQDLSSIKQQLQSVAAETHSLSVNERARSQDFLALYNKTVNIEKTTSHRIGKYQNTTKLQFDQLENSTFANLNKEVQTIKLNLNMSLAQLEQQINDDSRKVALTSCVTSEKTYSTGTLIKFDDVRTSVGIKNLSAFKTSGKFSCEVNGLYHISVDIVTSTAGSTYSLYKNNTKLITTYDDNAGHAGPSPSVVVVDMNVGDTISTIPDKDMYIYARHWSCITIAMLK